MMLRTTWKMCPVTLLLTLPGCGSGEKPATELIDAGASEAGPSEAGAGEAGPSEAGPKEAGPSEAGPSEAGPDDVGPHCPAPTAGGALFTGRRLA